LLALVLAGCGASAGPPNEPSEHPLGPSPSPTAPSASLGPSPSSPAESRTPSSAIVADETLLDVLPEAVDGLTLVPIPEAVPEAAADPAVAAVVDRMAFAVAVDPASGDQVVALVAHLRSGSLDAAGYRAWRDSFDRGVCERAGGISGHAELSLGGRSVEVGICAAGVRTYHVLVPERGLVVSVQSLGERRLGEALVAAIGR
jgi:hypothetical protein